MNVIERFEFTPFLSAVHPPSFWKRLASWFGKRTEEPRAQPSSDPATYSPCNPEERLNEYKKLLEDARTIYVFRNGTAVYSADVMSESDAINIMREHGHVRPGTPSADFFVASIESPVTGIAVRYSHPQIVSFESFALGISKVAAGSLIRLSRDMDSYDLHVVARYVKEG